MSEAQSESAAGSAAQALTDEDLGALAPGTVVDHFSVVRPLGRGGTAVVYLARDSKLGRRVALKMVRPSAASSANARAAFLHEARATARFNHPNIVAIHWVGEWRGVPYVALEYLEGQTLRQRVAERPLGAAEATRCGLAVARALEVAHGAGIVHADLKPENVLIPTDGRVRVVDFGLARVMGGDEPGGAELGSGEVGDGAAGAGAAAAGAAAAGAGGGADVGGPTAAGGDESDEQGELGEQAEGDALARPRVTVRRRRGVVVAQRVEAAPPLRVQGTPAYMAPEQWRGQQISGATDIWALGLMLGEMAAHWRPFPMRGRREVSEAVCDSTPVSLADEELEGLPSELVALVGACLERRAVKRPSASEVVNVLERLLPGATAQRSVAAGGPFRGLLPFEDEHAGLFFGREAEIAAAVERLRREPVLPLVGPSGAGKTSLIHAGIVVRLREQERWSVLRLRPGRHPFLALAQQLLRADARASSVDVSNVTTVVPDEGGGALPSAALRSDGSVPRAEAGDPAGQGEPAARGAGDDDANVATDAERAAAVAAAAAAAVAAAETVTVDVEVPASKAVSSPARAALSRTPEELAQVLVERPELLSLILREMAQRRGRRVLLVVDQLEEVCTLVEDERLRRRFIAAVCGAADDQDDPQRVVLSMRDDYLGRIAETPQAREVLSRLMLVRTPGREALEQIVRRPLELLDFSFDDDSLVDEMIDAVRGEPAALPLLQVAAAMLWERRDTRARVVTSAAYRSIGGVAGALAQHADAVLDELGPAQLAVAREVLLRLVSAEGTRQVLTRVSAIEGLDAQGADPDAVISRLVRGRLVNARQLAGEGEQGGELEIVHESLLVRWARLARWIEQSREELRFLAEARQAADLWERRGRRPTELWVGEALAEARAKLARCTTRPPRVVEAFLAECGAAEDARRARRRRAHVALIASLVIVAGVASAVAYVVADRGRQAREQRERARARWAEALREGAAAALLRGDMLEARAKLRASLQLRDSAGARALWRRVARHPQVWRVRTPAIVYAVASCRGGRVIAAASQARVVYLFDRDTSAVRVLRGHRDQVFAVACSPDGAHLVSGSLDGEVRLWRLRGPPKSRVLARHRGAVRGLAFIGGPRYVVSAGVDGRVLVAATGASGAGAPVALRGTSGEPLSALAAFGARGLVAAGGADARVRVWSIDAAATKTAIAAARPVVVDVDARINGLSFGPRGRLAAGAADGRIILLRGRGAAWRVERSYLAHRGGVRALRFSSNGATLVSAGLDGRVLLWRLGSGVGGASGRDSGARPRRLARHAAAVYGLAVGPLGRWIASGGADRTVQLLDAQREVRRRARALPPHSGSVSGVAFSPDGKRLASSGADGTVRLWNIGSGRVLRVLRGHSDRASDVAFSPDGALIASSGWDRTVRLWRARDGAALRALGGHGAGVMAVRFAPGRGAARVASAGRDGAVRLFDAKTGKLLATMRGHSGPVADLAFSPDGELIASAGYDRTVRLWAAPSGAARGALSGHTGRIFAVVFGADASTLYSASFDGSVRRWAIGKGAASARSEVLLSGGGRLYRMVRGRDGALYVAGADGSARRIALSKGKAGGKRAGVRVRVLLRHRSEVNALALDERGRLASASDDGSVRLWHARSGRPLWRGVIAIDRPASVLTHRGWRSLALARERTVLIDAPWRALASRAWLGAASRETVCLVLRSGGRWRLMMWRRARDTRPRDVLLGSAALAKGGAGGVADAGRVDVRAPSGGGCLSLYGGVARYHPWTGSARALVREARAIGLGAPGELLVARANAVERFGRDGASQARAVLASGPSAVTASGDALFLGFADGSIERRPRLGATPSRARAPASFEGVASSAVTRLLPGPAGTLVAGFADGSVAMWRARGGARLEHGRVHGPVRFLLRAGRALHAVSALGDRLRWDLSVFNTERCELLRQVWRRSPAVWEAGRSVRRAAPRGHRCASTLTSAASR